MGMAEWAADLGNEVADARWVTVQVAADEPGMVVVRRVVAEMGARADLLVDEIDDLADLVADTCEAGGGSPVTVRVRGAGGVVELRIEGRGEPPPTIGALAAEYEREVLAAGLRHRIVVRARG